MMNMKKIKIAGAFAIMATLFSSCADTTFEPIPVGQLMGDSLVANYKISQLIDSFMTDSDTYSDVKYSKQNSGLFTADLIKSTGDVVIKGVVTSSDAEGNIYKYMTIQEDNGQAIKISIDASGLSGIYPLGQRVWIRCNGLYLGKYAQSPQIGTLYYNTTKFVTKQTIKYDSVKMKNDTTITTIYRKEPGRIPLPVALKAIHAFGMPDLSLAKADTITIAEIRAAGPSVINKLVCIKNAYFTGKGADYGLPVSLKDDELIFAPSTNGVGYPQSREIKDPTGSIFISTSEYSKFAGYKLPSSGNIGNITAIVGWYNDKKAAVTPTSVTTEIYHQLTLRGMMDLGKGFESYHAEIDKK